MVTRVTGEVLGAEPALTLPIHRIATRLLIPINCRTVRVPTGSDGSKGAVGVP